MTPSSKSMKPLGKPAPFTNRPDKQWRDVLLAFALFVAGVFAGMLSEGILPSDMPWGTRVAFVLGIGVFALWCIFKSSPYYDVTKYNRNNGVLLVVIFLLVGTFGSGVAIYHDAPTRDEVVKSLVRDWIGEQSDIQEVEPSKGDLFMFVFKVPRSAILGDKYPDDQRFPAIAVLNADTRQILVGIRMNAIRYTAFADCVPPVMQDRLKKELYEFANGLVGTETTIHRSGQRPMLVQTVVALESTSATRTEFTAATNLVLKSMRNLKSFMADQISKYGVYRIAGDPNRNCTTEPCQCIAETDEHESSLLNSTKSPPRSSGNQD